MNHIENIGKEQPLFQPGQVSSSQMRLNPLVVGKTGICQYATRSMAGYGYGDLFHSTTTESKKLDLPPTTMKEQSNFQQNLLNWLTEEKLTNLAREFIKNPKRFEEEHQDILKVAVERVEAKNRWNELVVRLKTDK